MEMQNWCPVEVHQSAENQGKSLEFTTAIIKVPLFFIGWVGGGGGEWEAGGI